MKAITYRITLLEPLLATRLGGDPNNAVSFPYIPGSQLRGAVIAAYLRAEKLSKIDAGEPAVREKFFDPRTRYLNAYPLTQSGKRMLPTPHSWQLIKDRDEPVYDFALGVRSEIDDEYQQFQPAANRHPFCWAEDERVEFHKQVRQVNVHTARDRRMGRAVEGEGGVFQYDAIAEGEQFGGLVLTDQDDAADDLALYLRGILVLGGSSSGGYGRVRVEVADPVTITEQGWREALGHANALPAASPFTVTLLSDTIVRDRQTGQYSTELLPALQEMLGFDLCKVQVSETTVEEQRPARRVELSGGFNREWGLPLPQAQSIGAGSVFVFQSTQPIDAATLWRLEWRGIGERRAEGFGRLAFQWQTQPELSIYRPKQEASGDQYPGLTGVSEQLARQMTGRLLRRELDAALARRLNMISIDKKSTPSSAQLTRFRVIARDALGAGDMSRIEKLLTSILQRRSARSQFERARVQGERLSDWLSRLVKNPMLVWDQLGTQQATWQLGTNVHSGVKDNLSLATEYAIRLMDGLMAKAARERREGEEQDR